MILYLDVTAIPNLFVKCGWYGGYYFDGHCRLSHFCSVSYAFAFIELIAREFHLKPINIPRLRSVDLSEVASAWNFYNPLQNKSERSLKREHHHNIKKITQKHRRDHGR